MTGLKRDRGASDKDLSGDPRRPLIATRAALAKDFHSHLYHDVVGLEDYVDGTTAPTSVAMTYNADGTVDTITKTPSGEVITFVYNDDGSVDTMSYALAGVTDNW